MENQFRTIEEYLGKITAELRAAAPHDTGALANSIDTTINWTDEGFIINVSMLDYGLYQDQGVNGTETKWGSPFSFKSKMPPALAFETGSIGGGFAIARSIFENGIKPKHFIDRTIDRLLPGLENVSESGLLDYLEQIFTEEKTI